MTRNRVSPRHRAERLAAGEGARLLGTELVHVFGDDFGVLAMNVIDVISKLVQESDRINAHAQKVRRVIVDAERVRVQRVDRCSVAFRRAAKCAVARPTLYDEVCAKLFHLGTKRLEAFDHELEVLASRSLRLRREHNGEEVRRAELHASFDVRNVCVERLLASICIGGQESAPILEVSRTDLQSCVNDLRSYFVRVSAEVDARKTVVFRPRGESAKVLLPVRPSASEANAVAACSSCKHYGGKVTTGYGTISLECRLCPC